LTIRLDSLLLLLIEVLKILNSLYFNHLFIYYTVLDDTNQDTTPHNNTNNSTLAEDREEVMDADEELFLAFRLEEEEQINRAILQSLQESNQLSIVQANQTNNTDVLNESINTLNSSMAGNLSTNVSMNDSMAAGMIDAPAATNEDMEDKIAVLVGLGFTQERVIVVLELCHGNIEEAANYLVNNA
jgi:UBA/TS-N domain